MSDLITALKARRAGARWASRIISECHRNGIRVSLGFALVEQESGFSNVFGHDPTIFVGAGTVTKAKYLAYKKQRGRSHMQGVGPCQLTWWATQDTADRMGGCYKPGVNIAVGIAALAANIHKQGERAGIAAYNGTGAAAAAYATSLLNKAAKWHKVLS